MAGFQQTISLNVSGAGSVSYSYGGLANQATCTLTGSDVPGQDPSATYVFQLDAPSISAHWTLAGYRAGAGSDLTSLQFTAGPGNPCTSYEVHDPGTSDEPCSWSLHYVNTQTGASFWSGAEPSEGSPSIQRIPGSGQEPGWTN